MKKLFFILSFIALAISVKAQESHWRFENNGNDEKANHSLIAKNGATFSNTDVLEGTYRANFNVRSGNRMVTSNKFNFGSDGVTIVVNFKQSNTSSPYYIMGNSVNAMSTGFGLYLKGTTRKICFETKNSQSIWNEATTSNNAYTSGAWTTVAVRIMDTDVGYASIFVNGIKNTSDSTIRPDWLKNDTLSIGALRNATGTFYGSMDNIQIYKCALPDTIIRELFNNRESNYEVRPTVTTKAISDTTDTTARSGGNVISYCQVAVSARGVCWSTTANPTIADSHTTNGYGPGTFISSITGLTPCTIYHVRAYATTIAGTFYGNEVQFTTLPCAHTVTTTTVSAIKQTTATSGGNVVADCGASVTARGVCWSTTANPTTANSKTTDGAGTGAFTSYITGLTACTPYHVRAYATNNCGITSYGSNIQFTTECIPPPVAYKHLSHNQYMVTYAGAFNNDIVGLFDPWYPTKDTTSGTFSYSLIDDEGGIYAINSSSGSVTILNNTGMTAGTDILTVQVTLANGWTLTEIDTIWVTVKATADCYFIDPSGSNGSGTRVSPFNSWIDLPLAPGKAFFGKRGTTYTVSNKTLLNVNGTLGSEIIMGSYGTGTRHTLNRPTSGLIFDLRASFCQFYELHFTGNGDNAIKQTNDGIKHTNSLFTDLSSNDAENFNGVLFFQPITGENDPEAWNYITNHRIYDIDFSNGAEFSIKVEIGSFIIENIKAYNFGYNGVDLATQSKNCIVSGVLSYNNGLYAMEASGKYHHISYSILKSSTGYANIEVDDSTSYGSRIDHCIIDGSNGRGLIHLRCGGNDNPPIIPYNLNRKNFIIEDNELKNSSSGTAAVEIIWYTDSVIVRRNNIHNCYYGVLIGGTGVSESNDILVHSNIFYGNTYDIYGSAGERIWVLNNTCDGTIDLSGTTLDTVRNNYFKVNIGATYSSNNIDIDTINTNLHFTNYAGHNYHLKSTASSARDHGYDWGQTSDYDGNPMFGSQWDIGAYEYSEPKNSARVVSNLQVQNLPVPPADNIFPKSTTSLPSSPSINQVVIYPNPFSDEIILENVGNIESIEILNILGEVVLVERNTDLTKVTLNLGQLKSGYYFIKLIDNSANVITQKIVKN